MGLLRRLKQWHEKRDGTLEGPAISTDRARVTDNATITANVPSDFSTLQAAVDYAISHVPPNDQTVVVNIESGHAIQTGQTRSDPAGQIADEPVAVWVENADASHVVIRSEDATVQVEDGFDGSIIRSIRSSGPVLDCLIDMRSLGSGSTGYSAEMGSVGWVNGHNGAGVINAPNRGLWARQTSLVYAAFGVNFHGAGSRSCDVNHGSSAYIRGGDFSGSGSIGLRARGGTKVDAQDCDFSGATSFGMRVEGTNVYALGCDASASDIGVYTKSASVISMRSATVTNCGSVAVEVDGSSRVDLQNADLSGAGDRAINALGGEVDARDANASNAGGRGINASNGATVKARGADGRVGGDTTGSNDIRVNTGAIIAAYNASGGLSQTANSVTSDGIIFQ